MDLKYLKTIQIYEENKVEDGIFLVNGDEYLVIVHIYDYDDVKFVELEERSMFFHDGMVIFTDRPREREVQLIFENLEDARAFLQNIEPGQ